MEVIEGFRARLAKRQKFADSLVICGLDPLASKLPPVITRRYGDYGVGRAVYEWMRTIVDAVAPFVCMFKPNVAHWDDIPEGRAYLRELVRYIHTQYPDILVFLDCKVGDIGRTQERYAVSHFGLDNADGINFTPYMGRDCEAALVKDEELSLGKGIVGVCYTSNPDARAIQDLLVSVEGNLVPLWEVIAGNVLQWSKELGVVGNAGLVMAAAYEDPNKKGQIYSYHLVRGREIVGDDLWFLIPGVGAQGGYVEETVQACFRGSGSIAINSSSGITNVSQEDDYAQAAAGAAEELRDQIRQAGGSIPTSNPIH